MLLWTRLSIRAMGFSMVVMVLATMGYSERGFDT